VEVLIYDEAPGRARENVLTMKIGVPAITARALIRFRVELEAERLNDERRQAVAAAMVRDFTDAARLKKFLVVPDSIERQLNGDRGAFGPGTRAFAARPGAAVPPEVDVEAMVATALAAFDRGNFFLFINDRQVTDLDEEIDLAKSPAVTFFKLTPLQGG
jgi:hypothetical protein